MSKSKLQITAQRRNSYKGRVKGLRNNIRGMLDTPDGLHPNELENLKYIESQLNDIMLSWDEMWDQIKEEL